MDTSGRAWMGRTADRSALGRPMWSKMRSCRNWPRKSDAEADNGSARDVRRVEIGRGVCMAGTHTSWEAAG
jgi:hypothetical protein